MKTLLASIAVKTTGKSAVKAVGSWKAAAAVAAALSPSWPRRYGGGRRPGAAGGWLIVDRLAVEADEFLNRDDLERELVALTDERRTEIAAADFLHTDRADFGLKGAKPMPDYGIIAEY